MPFEILLVAVPIALAGGVIWYAHVAEKKRIAEMGVVARTMGFAFEEKLDVAAGDRFGDLPLFSRGHSRRATSVMTGELAGEPAVALDYRFVVGSGKNSQTHNQTVAMFPTRGRGIADFELAPENILHKLGQVFGYQDIDFEQHPEFSRRYLLRGENEAEIRRVFDVSVIAGLERSPGWSMQSRGNVVCAFRSRRRCKPQEVPAFLAEALQMVAGLTPRGS